MDWKGMRGKRISVYFDDGVKITRHDGICTNIDSDLICLDNTEIIPMRRIIRIGVQP